MTINKDELRRLAEAATPGLWHHATDVGQVGSVDVGDRVLAQAQQLSPRDNAQRDANASFIAAANPSTILALLDELEAAQRDAERYLKLCRSGRFCPSAFGNGWALQMAGEPTTKHELDDAVDDMQEQKP
jgi:hypothetical protein